MLLLVLVATGPLTTATFASPSSTADRDDAPFAEAGLDQESTVGDRVLLDGGGSRAVTGDIVEYDWNITGPAGTAVRPSCPTCARTAFVPDRPGRYTVTLTVTDAAGRTDSDTMYVRAGTADVPGVSISGPRRITSNRPAEFTATVRPGDAELTRVVWSVDGRSVENATIGDERTVSLERTFTRTGTVQVNATVHDRAGRERTASRTVEVSPPTYTRSSTPRPSLSVRGPRVLTGEGPFEGTYRLGGSDADDAESVIWRRGDGELGSGTDLDVEWEPGTHELTAFADVGDEGYSVSFENGTTVVVDPRPDVSLKTSQSNDTLSGTVEATDEFGNLDSVRLFVDDERVREWSGANGTRFETSFSVALDKDQNSNRVRVVAVDGRGQSVSETNEAGEPELVRSGFVNGPVDSYDPRIDSDRYTAVHETVIDLNGVDPGEVSLKIGPSENYSDLQRLDVSRNYVHSKDNIKVVSKWAGQAPNSYKITSIYGDLEANTDVFEVTYSDPEPRIEVIDEGEDSEDKAHRLLIDVSDSFDPDGGSLEFRAQDRDRKPNDPDRIALEFSDTPGLKIIDEQRNSVDLSSELYDYWSPEFKQVEEVSEGPYEPNDTIRFKVKTETFHLADRDYDLSLDLQLDGANGDVTEWRRVSHSADAGHDPNLHEVRHPQYVGTVEVTAQSYLDPETPYLVIANDEEASWEPLPSAPVVEEEEDLTRNNISITSIEYTQEETIEKTVSSRAARARYEAKGYRVTDTSKTLETITIERRQSAPPEVVDTQTFSSRTERRRFLSTRPNWSPDGTTVQTQSIETTEWLDLPHPGRGYTGEKRTKRICSGSGAFMRGGRCVPFDSTDSVTQYLHRYEEKEDKTMYKAKKLTSGDHWDPIGVVSTRDEAAKWSEHPGIRAGSRTYSQDWEMMKNTGGLTVSDSYSDASEVVRTTATVKYDRQYSVRRGSRMHDTSTTLEKTVTVDQVKGTTTFEGLKSRKQIIQSVESGGRVSTSDCSMDGSLGC